jgi:hypothetical protein
MHDRRSMRTAIAARNCAFSRILWVATSCGGGGATSRGTLACAHSAEELVGGEFPFLVDGAVGKDSVAFSCIQSSTIYTMTSLHHRAITNTLITPHPNTSAVR